VVLVIGISAVSIIYYNQINEISTLSDQKTELESSKADLMEQLVELEAGLIAISGTIIDLEAQLKNLETENIKINDDIEKKKSENQKLIGDISSREETIMILEAELVEAKTQLSEFGEQIEQLLVEIEDLESQAAIPATPPASEEAPPASEEAPPASEEAPPASEEETLANDEVIGGHLDPLIMATLNCEECHTKVTEQAFAEESNIYHNAMLNNNLLNFSCADCHKSVDILSESEDLSRVIDNATCVKCHTAFPDKQWMQSISNAKSFAKLFPDCQECHGDWKSRMDDATFVNIENIDVNTNSDCRTCHVDNVLFDVEKERITLSCGNCH
jgi:hypothetical protein